MDGSAHTAPLSVRCAGATCTVQEAGPCRPSKLHACVAHCFQTSPRDYSFSWGTGTPVRSADAV